MREDGFRYHTMAEIEINPPVDPGYASAQHASRIFRECLNGIAMRRCGITREHFLSPLTTDRGRD